MKVKNTSKMTQFVPGLSLPAFSPLEVRTVTLDQALVLLNNPHFESVRKEKKVLSSKK